jgi:hypothetical protein
MARLIWLLLTVALGGALLAGASWTAATARVSGLLGAPPPQMGERNTAFLWEGMPKKPGNPKAWLFTYGPTKIPGAPRVRIWVSPIGQILQTEPGDLEAKLQAFHAKGY